MRIVREKPSQRRHHRVTAPLFVVIAGERYQAGDWSLGGLRVDAFKDALPEVGSDIELIVDVPFQGFSISFDVAAAVARHTEDGAGFAVTFTDLPERAHDLMKHFIEDLIRGQMASVDDVICRIDIPVTPISTKPDPNPNTEVPVRRWSFKTVFMTTFYLVLGVAVFSYVGVLVYANLIQLEIKTAVVSKPIETISMPIDGTVSSVLVEPGSAVRRGEALLTIQNRELEVKIDNAEIALMSSKSALQRARDKLRVEEQRLRDYRHINATELNEARADLTGKESSLEVAKRHLKRIEELHRKGHATDRQLDLARGDMILSKARVAAMKETVSRSGRLASVSERRHHNGREFIVDLDLLRIDIEEREAERDEATAKLAALMKQRRTLFVRAPFDGTFTQLLHPAGAQLIRTAPLAVVEQAVEPVIDAFVSQEEILQVGLDDEAVIYLPALQRRVSATVVAIDRTSGFVDEQRSQYTWRGPKDRSARIELRLPADIAKDEKLSAGLPAVVVFNRRTTREVVARITGLFDSLGGKAYAKASRPETH